MAIEGVIRPPPEIRAVADRTALYVAKNGRAFEARILSSDKGKTPKFAFLHGTSPFHAYYEERVHFYENGGEDEKEEEIDEKKLEEPVKPTVPEEAVKAKQSQTGSVIDPVAKIVLAQRSKISQLRAELEEAAKISEDRYGDESDKKIPAVVSIPAPPPLQLIDIVAPPALSMAQIETIQIVAQFTAMEGNNGTFLAQLTQREWNNPDFGFCQPRHGHFAYFSSLVDAYRHIFGLWTAPTASDDSLKDMADNLEHCLTIAAYRSEYQRDQEEQAMKDHKMVSVAQIDWHDFVVVETIDFKLDEMVETIPPPPPVAAVPTATGEDVDESDDEGPIRVVPTYTPKVVAGQAHTLETVIDPITGKAVPVKDMPEHMRIQLLDPKWAQERKKFQEKQKESNLVDGDVVAGNLQRFAQARGVTKPDLLASQAESRKRLAEANRTLHEQAKSSMGPQLPVAGKPEALEPEAKRPRVEVTTTVEAPPPLGLKPPPGFEAVTTAASNNALVDDPFATAATLAHVGLSESGVELLPEAEFAARLPKPEVTLQIRVPNDRSQMVYNFYGQIVSTSVDVMSTVKAVKQKIAEAHLNGMPPNKIQLKTSDNGVFLKDGMTLAALNIGPTATLELVPRARGGRK